MPGARKLAQFAWPDCHDEVCVEMAAGLAWERYNADQIVAAPDERAKALARVGPIVEEPRFHGHLANQANASRPCSRVSDPGASG
jgi:hypothetical protein